MMKLYELSYGKGFQCLAGDCPDNCCKGWMIPLTEEDCRRFARERGLLGFRLALAMAAGAPGGEACLNESCGRCPFLSRGGLCTLQTRKGSGFIPEVCRDYPRFYRNYRLFEDRCIDLSCIHGARLFLRAEDRLRVEACEGEPGSAPCSTNDDEAYLKSLDRTRWEMIRRLGTVRTAEELRLALSAIADYAEGAQEAFLAGETDYLEREPFERFAGRSAYFPFPAGTYRRLMNTAFYNPRLRSAAPKLRRLCRLYFRRFRGLMRSQEKWRRCAEEFLARCPDAVRVIADYTAFYLFEHFLRTYEDYSFRRAARIGIIHANMVLLFFALSERAHGSLSGEAQAEILSVYSKRAYYNDTILNEMYRAAE